MNLNELYTQIITENSRSKQNRHPVEGATHSLEGVNPSCGDDIILELKEENGIIVDGAFVGSGNETRSRRVRVRRRRGLKRKRYFLINNCSNR